MKLIVGLGNPGNEYTVTRHNVGWMVLDSLTSGVVSTLPYVKEFGGMFTTLSSMTTGFFKPLTFMNSSGDAVSAIVSFYKLSPEDIIVIHDEMDIPFGDVRLKFGGGHAGHNGVKSVINRLGTKDFWRVRVGIGRPAENVEVIKHVLTPFSATEAQALPEALARAGAVAIGWLSREDENATSKEDSSF